MSIQREEAEATLKEFINPGMKIYTCLKHVSTSGMTRGISLYVVQDGGIRDISWLVGKVLELKMHPKGGLKVSGCGMDMGYHLVYSLGYYLWPRGTTGEQDGGYALDHSWL